MPQKTVEQAFGGMRARTTGRAVLDKERYISPLALAAEWERVWTRCWLFAGLESDVPDPGDYFVYELGRESIVLVLG